MQHLDEGTIHAWLDGALPPGEARDVEQHVGQCSECAAMVAEARGLVAGASRIVSSLDVIRGGVIPKTAAARAKKSVWGVLRLTPSRAALAATLMIAVSTLLVIRHDTREKMVPASAASPAADGRASAAAPSSPPPAAASLASPARVDAQPTARREVAGNEGKSLKRDAASGPAPAPARGLAEGRQMVDSVSAAKAQKAAANEVPPAPVGGQRQQVQQAVTQSTGAGAAANAVADRSLIDTARNKDLAKVSLDSARATRMSFAPATASRSAVREEFSMTGREPGSGVVGCYRFLADSALSSFSLPERFALDRLRADTSQHVVRLVAGDGKVGGQIAGSRWEQITPTELTVRFATTTDKPQTIAVRLMNSSALESRATAALERADLRSRALPAIRIDCRP